jgi:signal transduction histidine kinase
VEAHGGRIWVESEGHNPATCPGSAFHIVLPIRASQPSMQSKELVTVEDLTLN